MAYNNNNGNKRYEKKEEKQGLTVAVYNDNIEQALRKFKKKMTNDGKLQEVKNLPKTVRGKGGFGSTGK